MLLDNAVLRVPILYGPVEYLAESAVTVLYSSVKDTSAQCQMDHRQRRFPTHTTSVADIILQLVNRHDAQVRICLTNYTCRERLLCVCFTSMLRLLAAILSKRDIPFLRARSTQ